MKFNDIISDICQKLQKGGESNMPRRDGTGPVGRGPFTGRGLGNCDMPRRARRGQRKGFRRNQETLEERKDGLENEGQ